MEKRKAGIKKERNMLELQAMTPPASPDYSIPNNNNASNQLITASEEEGETWQNVTETIRSYKIS